MIHRLTGLGGGAVYGVHNNTAVNLYRGLAERVLRWCDKGVWKPPPTPAHNVFESRLSSFRTKLLSMMPVCRPISRKQFVESYEGPRRALYQRAVDSLARVAVSVKDAVTKPFVKAEKVLVLTRKDGLWVDKNVCPRVIQARSPRYNVSVGVYLKHTEKILLRGIDAVFGHKVCMKGLNGEGVGAAIAEAWQSFREPVALSVDMHRMDQHVSRSALKWEHSVHCGYFRGPDSRELAKLLRWQIVNKGKGRTDTGVVEYKVTGGRMSGDMNTSSGNIVIMCGVAHRFIETCPYPVRYINNGDDCIFICDRRNRADLEERLPGWYLDFGFNAVVEPPVYTLERISFCQTQPVWTPSGYIMVRDPRVCITKDCTSVSLNLSEPKVKAYWLHAIGTCGVAGHGGIPILQDFYSLLARAGRPSKRPMRVLRATGLWYQSRGMARVEVEPHWRTRASFFEAFGIPPEVQRAIESEYRSLDLTTLPPCSPDHGYSLSSHPIFDDALDY